MPLIPYPDLAAMERQDKAAFDFLQSLGPYNITRMWANAPGALVTGVPFGHAIGRDAKLAPVLRELTILATSRIEAAIYEWVQHVPLAAAAGCSAEQVAAIEAGDFGAPVFDAPQKALLRLVDEVVRKVRAEEDAVTEAKLHFDSREILEIIFLAGTYMMLGRMTETLRVEVDAPPGVAIPAFERLK